MKGYKEASKIDKLVNKLLSENPITEKNAREWMQFCRTISSGLEILNMEAREKLLPKGSNGETGGNR